MKFLDSLREFYHSAQEGPPLPDHALELAYERQQLPLRASLPALPPQDLTPESNLGPGNLKVSLTESISMPRNTSLVLGPREPPAPLRQNTWPETFAGLGRMRGSPVSQRPGSRLSSGCHPLHRASGGPTSVLLRRHCKSQGQTLNQMARLCRCLPAHTQQPSIVWVHGNRPKGSLYIKLGHH